MAIHPEIKVEMLIPWTGLYQINQELNGFVLFTSYKTSLSDKSHVHSMYLCNEIVELLRTKGGIHIQVTYLETFKDG